MPEPRLWFGRAVPRGLFHLSEPEATPKMLQMYCSAMNCR